MENKEIIKAIILKELEIEAKHISYEEYSNFLKDNYKLNDFVCIKQEAKNALSSLEGIGDENGVKKLFKNIRLYYDHLEKKWSTKEFKDKSLIESIKKTKFYQPIIIEVFEDNKKMLEDIKIQKAKPILFIEALKNLFKFNN